MTPVLPSLGMNSALVNVMVLDPAVSGGIRIWQSDQPEPSINTVIFREGVSTSSLVPVRIGENSGLTIRNSSLGTLHVVVDVQGYFADPAVVDTQESPQGVSDLRYAFRGQNALAATTDITSTTAGQEALAGLRQRQSTPDEQLDTSGYKVYDTSVRDGNASDGASQLILPPDLLFHGETVSKSGPNGAEGAACFEGSPTPEPTAEQDVGTRSADDFTWIYRKCVSRENYAFWFDFCYRLGKVRDDGSSLKDYFLLRQYGTCKSKSVFGMRSCRLTGQRSPGSKTGIQWDDWAPRRDTPFGCRDINIGIDVGPTSLGGTLQACEIIDMTKYRQAPGFSARWWSGVFPTYQSERDVDYQVSMEVAQGRTPPLRLTWSVAWGP